MPDVVLGLGATIEFATSAFEADIDPDSIQPPSLERSEHDTTKLSTAEVTSAQLANATAIPGKIVRAGPVTLDAEWDPDLDPPISEEAEVITITWPLATGQATGAKWAFSGFLKAVAPGPLSADEKATGTFTIVVAGAITRTAAVDS